MPSLSRPWPFSASGAFNLLGTAAEASIIWGSGRIADLASDSSGKKALLLIRLQAFAPILGLQSLALMLFKRLTPEIFATLDRLLYRVDRTDACEPDEAHNVNHRESDHRTDLTKQVQQQHTKPVAGPPSGPHDIEIVFPSLQNPGLQINKR